MTKVDGNTPVTQTTYDGTVETSQIQGTEGTSPGVGGDNGGVTGATGQAQAGGTSGGPDLDAPQGDIGAQSYADAAQAMGSFTIEDALIALAQASNKDKQSDNDAAVDKINVSYQKSMDAVSKEKDAAWMNFAATEVSAGLDMAGNAVSMSAAGSTMASSETSEAKLMAQSTIGQTKGAMIGDFGKMVGGALNLGGSLAQTDADSDKAQAQKESSYVDSERSHAQYADQMLTMVVQVLQQKAQAEHDAKTQMANYT